MPPEPEPEPEPEQRGELAPPPPAPASWLQRCCLSRCATRRPDWSTLQDPIGESVECAARGLTGRRYRALFPSPTEAEREGSEPPLLAFGSGDLLAEATPTPAALREGWAVGHVVAACGVPDTDPDATEPDAPLGPLGMFPQAFCARVARPALRRATHPFLEQAAAADRGELWFCEGESVMVRPSLPQHCLTVAWIGDCANALVCR